jgi:hypothetical protein
MVSSPEASSSQFLPLNRTTGWIEPVSTKQEHLWHKNKLHDTPSFEFWVMAWYTFFNHISPHQPLGVPRGPRRELRMLARTPSSRNLVSEYLYKATPVVYAKLTLIFWEGKGFSLSSEIWCIGLATQQNVFRLPQLIRTDPCEHRKVLLSQGADSIFSPASEHWTDPRLVVTLHPCEFLSSFRASFCGRPFASSAIPFDVTIPEAINLATASFRNLLAHSLSSGLVERALGGSQTVEISPGPRQKLVSKVPGIW